MSELTSGPIAGRDGERTLGWFFDWHHQWDSFTPGQNWRDFTLLHIGGEWAENTGRWEFSISILGLNATITYVYDDAFVRHLMEMRDDFRSRDEEGEPTL